METIEYRDIHDKSNWGDGPWQQEPDKKQWQDPTTGLPCLITRNHMGNLCGYVGVSEGHPAFKKDYSKIDVSCHGGCTFSDHCHTGPEDSTVCHIPGPGEPDHVWWFGFDCAHSYDHSPAMGALFARLKDQGLGLGDPVRHSLQHTVYRDWAYVENQVAQLALQLHLMKDAA